jgi:oligopeptide/dipeptide ABC transporter ATP-binding protein
MAMLDVRELITHYVLREGADVRAVDGVSLEVGEGSLFGLVGESGCGKSSCGLSILRLLPANASILAGQILFEGKDLLKMRESEMRRIRGKKISMIFQGAMNALDPVKRVNDQVAEMLLVHEGHDVGKSKALKRTSELFKALGMGPSTDKKYPHELSGGMKQRVMIAMSLICNPRLVIADEPTTSLDLMVETQIMNLIAEMKKKMGLSIILISHNIPRIVQYCDQIAVMYAGKIVEYADIASFLPSPLHPYSEGLVESTPEIRGPLRVLRTIPGEVPNLVELPSGCRFHPRCTYCEDICREKEPELLEIKNGHKVACHIVAREQANQSVNA